MGKKMIVVVSGMTHFLALLGSIESFLDLRCYPLVHKQLYGLRGDVFVHIGEGLLLQLPLFLILQRLALRLSSTNCIARWKI